MIYEDMGGIDKQTIQKIYGKTSVFRTLFIYYWS